MPNLETAAVEHIAFYPVKSCGGIELQSAILTGAGLESEGYADRGFFIVRATSNDQGIHEFITQRDMRDAQDRPQSLADLALIKTKFVGCLLTLSCNGNYRIEVPPDADRGPQIPVRIWADDCLAIDQGDMLARWLSDSLNLKVRLVKAAGPFNREARQNYMLNQNMIWGQDAYPIHWFSGESLDELSQKTGEEIPWQTFRPNIVVSGIPAQFEHQVFKGEIAGIPFVDPKPCDRCPTTRVDQETGQIRDKKFWPEAILSTYKRWRNIEGDVKVIFGENMLPLGSGEIAVGDELVVTSYRNPPLVYGDQLNRLAS